MPDRGSEAWLKELRDHLTEVAGKLLDAARLAEHSGSLRAEIDRQLAAIRDMLDAIERHLDRSAAGADSDD